MLHTFILIKPEHEDYRRVYLQVLEQQRTLLHELDKTTETDEEIIRRHLSLLDLEKEKLRLKFEV